MVLLVEEYFDLTNKYKAIYGENTIVLMQVGAFFEVYGTKNNTSPTSIHEFSRMCDLNIANKNMSVGQDPVIMAGFKENFIEKYLNKIQGAGFTAIVYVQDEQEKNANPTRSLAGIFSPGTFFSNDPSVLTNNTMCLWIEYFEPKLKIVRGKRIDVGMANIDIFTGKTNVFQFSEMYAKKNPITYDELERFVSIYNPNEIIVITNLSAHEVEEVIQYANIESRSIHRVFLQSDANANAESATKHESMAKKCEKQTYQKEILQRFYPKMNFNQFMQLCYENTSSIQSLCFLLDFVFQHNPFLVNKISEPVFENISERLILANHSLKQLNIIDDNSFHGKYSSVLKMLNICITPMGKREFHSVCLNPISNSAKLKAEYDITEYLLAFNHPYKDLYALLEDIQDISKWSRQIILRKMSPKIFYQLSENLETIHRMQTFVSKDARLSAYMQNKIGTVYENTSTYCKNIAAFLHKNFNLDLCKDIDDIRNFDVNFIQQGVSIMLDDLSQIYLESVDKLNSISAYLNELIASAEKKSKTTTEYIKIHETEKNQFSLIATKRRSALLLSALPNTSVELKYVSSFNQKEKTFTLDNMKNVMELNAQTAANNSISSPQLNSLFKAITSIKGQLKDAVSKIYLECLEKAEGFLNELDVLSQFVTYTDVLYAKTTIVNRYHLCKPEIDDGAPKAFLDIKDLRHCLIENLQQNEIYVANNIILGKEQDGILLYGTNAVGKTSFIRAIGIAVIMAQAGLYVSASHMSYKPYTAIFTRILGNDNIFKGLSTFAVEMSELRNILLLADKNSLVLGDELCSGTESISAISIFVAGIQLLHHVESSFIFATHLHEIVNYTEICEMKRLVLKHMEVIYNKETDALVYDRKLKDGSGTNTYGLEVCKSLNLPQAFMEQAHSIRMKYNPEMASVFSLKTSHFNAKKVVGLCEKCGTKMGAEVHHLQHQSNADINGIIRAPNGSVFHKNHVANLMTLCETCHDTMHKNASEHIRRQTTSGGAEYALDICSYTCG
jgi:DNA mismatch repair protein MutS